MNKNAKKFLSLLLAFVMVFAVAVPVFATEIGAEEDGTTANVAKVKIVGETNGLRIDNEAEFIVFDGVRETKVKLVKGVAVAEITLEADKTYTVKPAEGTLLADDSEKEYTFKTDKDGKVVGELMPEYLFKLLVTQEENEGTVVFQNKEKDLLPKAEVDVYPALIKDGKFVFVNGTYVANTEIAAKKVTADDFGYAMVADFKHDAPAVVGEREVVVVVYENQVIAHIDVANDKKAVLTLVEPKVEVPEAVLPFFAFVNENKADAAGNPVNTPVAGVKIEVFEDTSKVGDTSLSYASKAHAEATTDRFGKAEIVEAALEKSLSEVVREYLGDEFVQFLKYGYAANQVKITVPAGYKLKNPLMAEMLSYELELSGEPEAVQIELVKVNNYSAPRIAGPNRYATSVEAAKYFLGQENGKPVTTADYVILASGENFADALVASSLVGALESPLVLTSNKTLAKETAAFLKSITIKKHILVVGKAIAPEVHEELEAMGFVTKTLGGENRFETAKNVLRFLADENKLEDTVLVADGRNFPDSLVASVPSAIYSYPIILTDGATFGANDLLAAYGIKNAIVLGGTASVPSSVFASIQVANKERLEGRNRQLTAMEVAKEWFAHGGAAVIVDGTDFPDAISAGQVAFKLKAPILLTQTKATLGADLAAFIKDNKMTDFTIVGGVGSVTPAAEAELGELLVK